MTLAALERIAWTLILLAAGTAIGIGISLLADRARTGRLRAKGPRPGRSDQAYLDYATEALPR